MEPQTQPAAQPSPEAIKPNGEPDLTGRALGDFQILRRLGQGGMGQVYLAEQISLKRKVALKLLRPDLAANETSLKRFQVEAENVARATHANIVQVYAIDERDGVHFMALEYIEGRNLREFIDKKGPPDALVGLGIMRQVAAALNRASELGIIHRDIKPENILITRTGEVKVADFGLSRVFAEGIQPLSLTKSDVTMGTPLYMSPEQVENRPVDPRTDIYSFGVTCYHMFAGQPPFRGQTPFEVAVQHVQKEPQPLTEIRPDLPADLCAIVHKMMAKKPEERYQTCREIVRDTARLRDVLVGVSSGLTSPLQLSGSGPLEGSLPSLSRGFPWRLTGVALVVLALAGGLYLGWARNQPAQPPTPPGLGKGEDPPTTKSDAAAKAELERTLAKRFQDDLHFGGRLGKGSAVKSSMDLAVFYLKDRKLDEADKLFKDLAAEKGNPQLLVLSRLGSAMVLAFRDESAPSNKLFLTVLDRDTFLPKPPKGLRENIFWKEHPEYCEVIARALNHNHANDPANFPKRLEPYRLPPAPNIRSTPADK
jgi:serine/threonine-protein kinase